MFFHLTECCYTIESRNSNLNENWLEISSKRWNVFTSHWIIKCLLKQRLEPWLSIIPGTIITRIYRQFCTLLFLLSWVWLINIYTKCNNSSRGDWKKLFHNKKCVWSLCIQLVCVEMRIKSLLNTRHKRTRICAKLSGIITIRNSAVWLPQLRLFFSMKFRL